MRVLAAFGRNFSVIREDSKEDSKEEVTDIVRTSKSEPNLKSNHESKKKGRAEGGVRLRKLFTRNARNFKSFDIADDCKDTESGQEITNNNTVFCKLDRQPPNAQVNIQYKRNLGALNQGISELSNHNAGEMPYEFDSDWRPTIISFTDEDHDSAAGSIGTGLENESNLHEEMKGEYSNENNPRSEKGTMQITALSDPKRFSDSFNMCLMPEIEGKVQDWNCDTNGNTERGCKTLATSRPRGSSNESSPEDKHNAEHENIILEYGGHEEEDESLYEIDKNKIEGEMIMNAAKDTVRRRSILKRDQQSLPRYAVTSGKVRYSVGDIEKAPSASKACVDTGRRRNSTVTWKDLKAASEDRPVWMQGRRHAICEELERDRMYQGLSLRQWRKLILTNYCLLDYDLDF
ncbi:predicted protein [Nematostella vectensis]|uniref:Uncharacterized protein n=1 Tax=Nematostella vectensis TaxID=45351 RepID=A7RPG0_NEMVE|nr:predicted protein [Nematostella vectensis]|eukprot:XP_001638743.1 predicted protein [Nematostella vectensis]